MEKIYEQNGNQNNKKRSMQSKFSIMMSFVLAFVAMASIITVGFDSISFAIPNEETTPFPDTITTGSEADSGNRIRGPIADQQIALHYATINGVSKLVFCIESEKDIASNQNYNKEKEITDNGLLYLMSYLLSDDYKIVDETGAEVNEKVKGWLVQTAIWIYQNKVGALNNKTIGNTVAINETKVRAETRLYTMADFSTNLINSTKPLYESCKLTGSSLRNNTIGGILDEALAIHNGTSNWNQISLNISKKSDQVSITSDEKYYQSDVITVSPSSNGFLGYKIDISKAPKGTILVDTNNNEIKDLDNISEGKQFYVRVPVDKITEELKSFPISVTGAFKTDIAYRYTSGDYQAIAYVGKVTKHVNAGLDLSFNYTPDVPDTSITVAQSIYFIGLVILLAGVGIIYANIKPSKANQ